MLLRAILLIAAVLAAPGALAQVPRAYAAGGAALQGPAGIEVEMGGQLSWGDRFLVYASPANFVFFDGDPPQGYYTDTFSNGQTRCRNASNGQFADDERCLSEGDMEWRAVIGAQLRVADRLRVGGGAIYAFKSDDQEREKVLEPFASLTLDVLPKLGVELRGGAEYASAQLKLTF